MIKLKIEGPPEEIAAFISHVSKTDGINLNKSTEITKRAESHKWGSALAWAEVQPVQGLSADYSIYESKRGSKTKGRPKAGYVYLLPAYGDGGIVGYKIGKTTSPYSRRKSFGNKLYFQIEFIALVATDNHTALETTLHRHFASKRQGKSEFFNLDAADIAYIQNLMTAEDKAFLLKVNSSFKK
jgi:hypothetical protein